jgi:hypothetical protein
MNGNNCVSSEKVTAKEVEVIEVETKFSSE